MSFVLHTEALGLGQGKGPMVRGSGFRRKSGFLSQPRLSSMLWLPLWAHWAATPLPVSCDGQRPIVFSHVLAELMNRWVNLSTPSLHGCCHQPEHSGNVRRLAVVLVVNRGLRPLTSKAWLQQLVEVGRGHAGQKTDSPCWAQSHQADGMVPGDAA